MAVCVAAAKGIKIKDLVLFSFFFKHPPGSKLPIIFLFTLYFYRARCEVCAKLNLISLTFVNDKNNVHSFSA